MAAVDLVVFDMMGTTIVASDGIPEAFRRAFEVVGVTLRPDDIASIRGRSKIDAIRELLTAHCGASFCRAEAANVYASFKQHLMDGYRTGPLAAIAGAEDTFDWCRGNGIKVALTTGFDRELAGLLVARMQWESRVDALICNDDVNAGRPAPDLILAAMQRVGVADVARVAVVGDTVSDLEAGENAGTGWNIGVLSGAHAKDRLSEAPHTDLIPSVADLPALLKARAGC